MRTIDAGSRKSTLLTETNDPNFRTSDSCDLDRWAPEIQPLDERIAIDQCIAKSADTLPLLLAGTLDQAMMKIHAKPPRPKPPRPAPEPVPL